MLLKNKNKLIFSLIVFIFIISFVSFSYAVKTENVSEQLEQLKDILNSSSTYSAFQTTMLLNTAQNLMDAGIPYEDTEEIIKNSIERTFNAYSIKKLFDIILENQQEGLPSESLTNKINEGLAKNIDKNKIILVISAKAENLKIADNILKEAQEDGLKINDGEKMLEILADSLENDVPEESLSWLVKTGTTEGKSMEEIGEISEELSYLSMMASDSGLSPEEISLLFKKAIENSSNIEEICENIQSGLETEISTAKIEGGEGKPSATSDSGTLPTSSVESPVEIGETPTQESGEAPTDTSAAPEPETTPGDETPPPPEN